jgi:hypothetical protein
MSKPKYLLDENLDPRLKKALLDEVPEMTVWRVGDPIEFIDHLRYLPIV